MWRDYVVNLLYIYTKIGHYIIYDVCISFDCSFARKKQTNSKLFMDAGGEKNALRIFS